MVVARGQWPNPADWRGALSFWGRWGPGWAGGFLIPSVTGIPGRAREEGSGLPWEAVFPGANCGSAERDVLRDRTSPLTRRLSTPPCLTPTALPGSRVLAGQAFLWSCRETDERQEWVRLQHDGEVTFCPACWGRNLKPGVPPAPTQAQRGLPTSGPRKSHDQVPQEGHRWPGARRPQPYVPDSSSADRAPSQVTPPCRCTMPTPGQLSSATVR